MDDIILIGECRVDFLRNETFHHGKTFRLTPMEAKVLRVLASHPNTLWTLEALNLAVFDLANEDTLVVLHIRHLRRKIEEVPWEPKYLLTVPNGYQLTI